MSIFLIPLDHFDCRVYNMGDAPMFLYSVVILHLNGELQDCEIEAECEDSAAEEAAFIFPDSLVLSIDFLESTNE